MVKPRDMKDSEARILILLSQVPGHLKFKMAISDKLNIDYVYLNRIMKSLEAKGWILRAKTMIGKKVFYDISELGRLKIAEAKHQLSKINEV